QKEKEKNKQQLQNIANDTAKNWGKFMTVVISQKGIDGMWEEIEKDMYAKGITLYKSVTDNITTGIYSQVLDTLQVFGEFSVNTKTQQCRYIIEMPMWGVKAIDTSSYTLPQTQPQINVVDVVDDYLGIITSTEKTKEGGFTILRVSPGGRSALAGVKENDVLIKIDTHELKEHDIERLASYVVLRYQQKAILTTTLLRNGETKVVEIQL
ncbi:MAG: PDZ domain-containing protein, partial [Synergistaceae bacterium]|nr:PDZ domain-containing protein [Synergistaceae bacterium]